MVPEHMTDTIDWPTRTISPDAAPIPPLMSGYQPPAPEWLQDVQPVESNDKFDKFLDPDAVLTPFEQFIRRMDYGIEPSEMPIKRERPPLKPRNGIRLTPAMLPSGSTVTFDDSGFFLRPGGPHKLPTPSEVRAAQTVHPEHPADRPRPVAFPSLGLIVKYGIHTSISEAQCMWAVRHLLRDAVPVPEVYGWCIDNGDVYVYMQLIPGVQLDKVWPSLSEPQRLDVCAQLRESISQLRRLEQDPSDVIIADVAHQPVDDILFVYGGLSPAGPFTEVAQLHDHLALFVYRRTDPNYTHPYRYMLHDEAGIMFTHNDLSFCNILVDEPLDGKAPRITGVVDWHQSGWMPDYWESYKLRWLMDGGKDNWCELYLSKILDPVDDGEDYEYWLQHLRFLGL